MTKAQALEAVAVLAKAIEKIDRLLKKALCDKCPTCDGTVNKARLHVQKSLLRAVKILQNGK